MRIRSGRTTLELHEMQSEEGPALLLLHELYGSSSNWHELVPAWRGRVYGLDFSGHGASEWIVGGAYCPELLLADADAALAAIENAVVVGAGLGAYIGLLLAGARPQQVPAALLLPGEGLVGGGPEPDFEAPFPDALIAEQTVTTHGSRCDPCVAVLEDFARPPAYCLRFARAATRLLLFEDGTDRPPWWEAARQGERVEQVRNDLPTAMKQLRG